MARKKTPPHRVEARASLSGRLREIRQELFGQAGAAELARRLGVSPRSWYNYEHGVAVPAEILLGFLEQTDANPRWLLSGEGPRFHQGCDEGSFGMLTPIELIRRALERLERSSGKVIVDAEDLPGEVASEFVAVGLYPFTDISRAVLDPARIEGHVLACRQWLPNPTATIGTRVIDEAMHPILPPGSIVAVDRSVTDPLKLDGQMVVACRDGMPMIRWLETHGRHLMLRPNQSSRDYPSIPLALDEQPNPGIIGQVVWSCRHFQSDMTGGPAADPGFPS